jgi:hypothetical protein
MNATSSFKLVIRMARPGKILSLLRFFFALAAFALASGSIAAQAKPGDEAAKPDVPANPDAPIESPEAPAKTPETAAPRKSSDLPWVKQKAKADPLPILRPPTSVREIMEKYDIGESQLEGFFAGQPLSPSEEEVMVRILYRLPRIGLESIQKWRKPKVQLSQLVADPGEHRLEVIPLQGRLIGVEKKEVTPELASRLEFKNYYLARIDLVDTDFEAMVAVRRVPQYWLDAMEQETPELDEPVSVDGMYLKFFGDIDRPQLLFVARRIHWRPDREIPEMNIGSDQLRLAEFGLDLSLLEDLKQSNRRELGDLDREPQYQLLDLAGRIPLKELFPESLPEIDVVALLKEPEKHHGEMIAVSGLAQRITKIVVEDPDIRARFGITHYYEIDLGVNLGKKTIRIVDHPKDKKLDPAKKEIDAQQDEKKKDENDDQVFNNEYPVTICVRELEPGLEPADHMRDRVYVSGIFMKTWAYRSQKLANSPNKMQVAPLIVGKIAYRVVPEKVYNWLSDVLVGFAMLAAALLVGMVLWWFRGSEKVVRETLRDLESKSPPNFAGLENAPTKPDFSTLEKSEPKTDAAK